MTTRPLLVDVSGSPSIVKAVSTLPLSYRVGSGGDRSDIVVVDGSDGWVDRATKASESGCRGIVVVDPGVARPDAVRRLHGTNRVPVILSEQWADDPAIDAAAAAWSAHLASAHSVEAVLIQRSPLSAEDATLALFRVLRRLSVDSVTLGDSVTTASTSLQLARTHRGATVRLMRIANGARNGLLRVFAAGSKDRIDIALDSPETARPGVARRVHASGAELLPVAYETSARRALLRLRDAVVSGDRVDELSGFADDVEALPKKW